MTAKIDLTDLFDLFAKTEEKPPIDPPISPEARRWRANFTTNVEAILRVRKLSRPAAEEAAYQNVLVEFLNGSMPANCDPNACFWCLRIEGAGRAFDPTRVRGARSWLHREPCAEKWRDHRRTDAIEKLAAMEIVRP